MEYAKVNIGKSFKDIVEHSKDGDLFELYVIADQGYTPKRCLCKVHTMEDALNKYIIITPYDKFGRVIYGWYIPYSIRFGIRENGDEFYNCLKSDEIKNCGYGYVFTLSKEKAYQHCMHILRSKVQELKKKEMQIHDIIYGI